MSKRTQIQDYKHVEQPEDLERMVRDKRSGKRANTTKSKRRNRHYQKAFLRHLMEAKKGEHHECG